MSVTEALTSRISVYEDHDLLFKSAIAEGTAFLLYRDLKDLDEWKDTELLSKLKSSYYHNLTQNLFWSERFLKDYSSWTEGFESIVLKGLFLIQEIYEDPGLRHLGDVDILVREKDYPQIRRRLETEGYLFNDEKGKHLNSVMGQVKDPDVRQPPIHLHWHLINSPLPYDLVNSSINLKKVWCDSVSFSTYSNIRALSPMHQVIYYAYHHMKHSFDRKIRLHDIVQTLRHYENDWNWDLFCREVEVFEMRHEIFFCFSLIQKQLGDFIPKNVLSSLKPSLSKHELEVLKQLEFGKKIHYAHYGLYLSRIKGLLPKIHFLWQSGFFKRPLRVLHHLVKGLLS